MSGERGENSLRREEMSGEECSPICPCGVASVGGPNSPTNEQVTMVPSPDSTEEEEPSFPISEEGVAVPILTNEDPSPLNNPVFRFK